MKTKKVALFFFFALMVRQYVCQIEHLYQFLSDTFHPVSGTSRNGSSYITTKRRGAITSADKRTNQSKCRSANTNSTSESEDVHLQEYYQQQE